MSGLELFVFVAFGVLTLSSLLCLYRIGRGPSAPDRTVAIDILGTLIVGFCCMMAVWTGREYYMNIAIAWALISFIGTLALAKYLEGRTYDA
jgi:multicomponent Na+:H+ antiporter subunit F